MMKDNEIMLTSCYAVFRQNVTLKENIDIIARNAGVPVKAVIEKALEEHALRNSDRPRIVAAGVTGALLDALKAWMADKAYLKEYVLRQRGEDAPREGDTDETYMRESLTFDELTLRHALFDFRTVLEKRLRDIARSSM